jgi:hypothetical protein
LREHLLFSSFVFPLLVKVVLSDAGLYELQKRDLRELEAFERLVGEVDVFARRGPEDEPGSTRWNEVMTDVAHEEFRRGWKAAMEQERRANAAPRAAEQVQSGDQECDSSTDG